VRFDRRMASEIDEAIAARYGNRYLIAEAPGKHFPDAGMGSVNAMRLVGQELFMDGDPQHNLATFVTTWMEPEAQRIIADNLHSGAGWSPPTPSPPTPRT